MRLERTSERATLADAAEQDRGLRVFATSPLTSARQR